MQDALSCIAVLNKYKKEHTYIYYSLMYTIITSRMGLRGQQAFYIEKPVVKFDDELNLKYWEFAHSKEKAYQIDVLQVVYYFPL